jgi:hypothetical protein
MEENDQLNMKVEALTNGWRRTVERVDRTHDKICSAQSTAFEYYEPGAAEQTYEEISNSAFADVTDSIAKFEAVAEKY